jgi:hypothetical protein
MDVDLDIFIYNIKYGIYIIRILREIENIKLSISGLSGKFEIMYWSHF